MLIERAVDQVARVVDVEFAAVLELQDDARLALGAAVGFGDDVIGIAIEGSAGSQAGYTLDAGKPTVVDDLGAETRLRSVPLLTELGVVSSVTVPISLGDRNHGVLGAYTTRRRSFSQDEIYFLESVANLLAAVVCSGPRGLLQGPFPWRAS